jgi:hypothetical protein
MAHRRRLLEQQSACPSLAPAGKGRGSIEDLNPRSSDAGLKGTVPLHLLFIIHVCAFGLAVENYASGLGGEHFADAADHAALSVIEREELETVA